MQGPAHWTSGPAMIISEWCPVRTLPFLHSYRLRSLRHFQHQFPAPLPVAAEGKLPLSARPGFPDQLPENRRGSGGPAAGPIPPPPPGGRRDILPNPGASKPAGLPGGRGPADQRHAPGISGHEGELGLATTWVGTASPWARPWTKTVLPLPSSPFRPPSPGASPARNRGARSRVALGLG